MRLYHHLSDVDLLVLLKAGNHLAYTEIYERYWAVLFKHARKMLHNDDEAGDIVQDIFTILWTKSIEIELRTSLQSYLYTAVRNKTIDIINRGRLTKSYLASLEDFIDDGEYVTDEQIRYKEFASLIDHEISQLPPKMREAFELSRKGNLSYKEIAREMNVADDTVKKQISKALKILRLKFGASFISIMILNVFR